MVPPEPTRDGEHSTLRERLHDQFGADVDPSVTLGDEPAKPPSSASAELVQRLTAHAPREPRYRLQGEIARGGMGAILKVWDEDLRRSLAMKVILGRKSADPDGDTPAVDPTTLARFLEEAQVTGQLDHPGIVPVHELGLDAGGRVYFTMRLVRGRDFKKIIDLVRAREEGWTLTKALGVVLKVCEALAYAHAKGVVHRDLKPANVMVGRFGETYVMDWGLAKVVGRKDSHDIRLRKETESLPSSVRTDQTPRQDEEDSPLVTMDGAVVGTPAYMSPEQAMGHVDEVDEKSDVYAVGATLYHLLTGQTPYVPKSAGVPAHTVWRWVMEGPPRPVHEIDRSIPPELVAICEKAMSRDRARRYADTMQIADDLQAYLEGRVVRAHRTGAVVELRKWVARNRGMAATTATAIAIAIGGLAALTYVEADGRRVAEQERAATKLERDAAQASEARAVESERRVLQRTYVANLLASKARLAAEEPEEALRYLRSCPPDLRRFEWNYLALAADPSLLTIDAHSNSITSMACSPDGIRLASGCADGNLRVWDLAKGSLLWTPSERTSGSAVQCISFSPDGRRLAAGFGDGRTNASVRVYDASSGVEIERSEGLQSKDGPQSWYFEGGVWTTAHALADQRLVFCAGRDLYWRMPKPDTWAQTLWSVPGPTFGVFPDFPNELGGSRHVFFDTDASHPDLWHGSAKAFDLNTTPFAPLRSSERFDNSIVSNSTSRCLVGLTSEEPHRVLLWNLDRSAMPVDLGQSGSQTRFSFSRGGDLLWGIDDGAYWSARAWLVGSLEALGTVRDQADVGRFPCRPLMTPDGEHLVVGSSRGRLRVFDPRVISASVRMNRDVSNILCGVALPGGRGVLLGSWHECLIVDPRSGQIRLRKAVRAEMTGVAVDETGSVAVTRAGEGAMEVWSTLDGSTIALLSDKAHDLGCAAFLPGTHLLVTGAGTKYEVPRHRDGTLSLWDTSSWTRTETRVAEELTICHLAVSPSGRWLLCGTEDGLMSVWDVQSWSRRTELRGHAGGVWSSCFSPDESWLATGGADRTIRTWDLSTGIQRNVLATGLVGVASLCVDSRGERLAAGVLKAGVRIWSVPQFDQLLDLDDSRQLESSETDMPSFLTFLDGDRSLLAAGLHLTRWHGDRDGVAQTVSAVATRCRIEEQAHHKVSELYSAGLSQAEVCRRLAEDDRVDSALRSTALDLAWFRTDSLDQLREEARALVTQPAATHGQLLHAIVLLGAVERWESEQDLVDLMQGETRQLFARALYQLGAYADSTERLDCIPEDELENDDRLLLAAARLRLRRIEPAIRLLDGLNEQFGPFGLSSGGWNHVEESELSLALELASACADRMPELVAAVGDACTDSALQDPAQLDEDTPRRLSRWASFLSMVAWSVVRDEHRTPAQCDAALRVAETAYELEPDSTRCLRTLGAAQFRAGRSAEARVTLLLVRERELDLPIDLALLALSAERLGEREAAQDWRRMFREQASLVQFADDADVKLLKNESSLLSIR